MFLPTILQSTPGGLESRVFPPPSPPGSTGGSLTGPGLLLSACFLSIATYGSQVGGNQPRESIDVVLFEGDTFLHKVSHLCSLRGS